MVRKKRESSGGLGAGNWMNPYSGMVTLLLAFFILLFSVSSIDAARFNMLVLALAGGKGSTARISIRGDAGDSPQTSAADAPGNATAEPARLEDVFSLFSDYIDEHRLNGAVAVSSGDGYVFIRFADNILFEPNSAILKPADQEILKFVGNGIRSIQNGVSLIQVSGHTAALPNNSGYAVSDWLLSAARANSVLMYFEDEAGVDPMKLQCVGWGRTRPLAANNTAEGRARNSRVEILISSDNPLAGQLDNIYENMAG